MEKQVWSEKRRDGESQKWEDAGARKGRKVAKHCVFPVFCGSGVSQSRLAKAAGAETSRQMRHEKLQAVVARSRFGSEMYKAPHCRSTFGSWDVEKYTPLWREAHLEVIMYKTRHVRTTFGTWDVQKVHAVVAQSKFESENVQNTTCSYHFLTMQWPSDVQKVHAVVARSTFGSQKC